MSGFKLECYFDTVEELENFVNLLNARVEVAGTEPLPTTSKSVTPPPPKKKRAPRKKKEAVKVVEPEVVPPKTTKQKADEIRDGLLQVATQKGNQVAKELLKRQGAKRLSQLLQWEDKWEAFLGDCKNILED